MAGPYSYFTRGRDSLALDMAAGASSATLTNGTFGTPSRKMIITIDGNVSSKAADFECTVSGAAVTGMTLLNGPDVTHTAGAVVWAGVVDEHMEGFTDFTGTTANAAGISYNPVWTTSGTAPSLGNGTLTGYSTKIGRMVRGHIRFVAGNTTAFGTGTWSFSLPYTPATTYVNDFPIGSVTIIDTGSTQYDGKAKINVTTSTVQPNASYRPTTYVEDINVTSTVPHTFASTDQILISFHYESLT